LVEFYPTAAIRVNNHGGGVAGAAQPFDDVTVAREALRMVRAV
jgi:hypothetical protein